MDITAATALFVVLAVVVTAVVALVRTVLLDGSGFRRAPEHGHQHWSASTGSGALPDAPYRDRVA